MKTFLRAWLPVLVWMGAIFAASTNLGSAENTGGFLEPILRWIFPSITHEAIEWCHFIARKCAHLSEYAVFAVLCWRALEKPFLVKSHPFTLKWATGALLMAAAYAGSDEFHQSFTSARTASVKDVTIDSCGALVGLLLIGAYQAWRRSRTTSAL